MVIKSGPGGESLRLVGASAAAIQRAKETDNEAERDRHLAEGLALACESQLAAAYTYLQRAVALIAVFLPIVVVLGHYVSGGRELLGSISAYYYTHMGNVFVGSLCALAVFFLSYNYRPVRSFELDRKLSRLACVLAVGVAVFPTASVGEAAAGAAAVVSALHRTFAVALFVLLGVFAHFIFTQTSSSAPMTPEKKKRNRLYRICGKVIFGSLAAGLAAAILKPPSSWHVLLGVETVCVWAFGISWLVKGGFLGILADKAPTAVPSPPTLDAARRW